MIRWNSEGIPREKLLQALRDRELVRIARRVDRCMLCRRHKVTDAGICEYCYATLSEAELSIAERWLSGVGP